MKIVILFYILNENYIKIAKTQSIKYILLKYYH